MSLKFEFNLRSASRIALVGVATVLAWQNCDNVNLSLTPGTAKAVLPPVQVQAQPSGEYCTLNVTITPAVKFYIAVDVTGSNVGGDKTDDGVAVPATDPGKVLRNGALIGLANKFTGAQFSLRTFNGDAVTTPFTSSYFSLTSQSNFLTQTMPAFDKIVDQNGTNYELILQQAVTDIQQYLQYQLTLPPTEQDPAGPIVVLFGSDGIPHSGCTDQACLQNLVNEITALPESMSATGVVPYITGGAFGWGGIFGPAGQASDEKRFLQWLADAFGGGLVIATGGQPLDLTQLPLPQPESAQGVSFDLFATNLNAVWDPTSDGNAVLNLDSDGDGISDVMEASLGSNPAVADSDGNGLTDGLEKYIWGSPCQLASCAPASPEERTPVKTCTQIPATDGGATGTYSSDILNNCEKIAAGLDYHYFSYLKDNVPDGVKIRNGLSPKDITLAQSTAGGLSSIEKITMNLPTFIPDPVGAGYTPTQYNLTFSGAQGGKNCYGFQVQNLPLVGTSPNKVRFWLTQTQSNAPDILRTADVMVTAGQAFTLTDDDFKPNQSDVQAAANQQVIKRATGQAKRPDRKPASSE